MRILALASAGAFACAILSACDFDGSGLEIVPEFDDRFSFETDADMEGWDARGLDLDDPPITWEIARSTEQATEGAHAVRFRLDNLNDQGRSGSSADTRWRRIRSTRSRSPSIS